MFKMKIKKYATSSEWMNKSLQIISQINLFITKESLGS